MAANPNAGSADAVPKREKQVILGPRAPVDRLALLRNEQGIAYVAYAPLISTPTSSVLRRRDAILAIDGAPVRPSTPLRAIVDHLRGMVQSGGVEVEVGTDPTIRTVTMTRPMWNVPFGIKLLNVQGNHAGIVVADVFPDSPAQRAGIRKLDRVLAVAGHNVQTTDGAIQYLRLATLRVKVTVAPHCDQYRCLSPKMNEIAGQLFCNGCRARIGEGDTAYGCRACDWDLCSVCFRDISPPRPMSPRFQLQSTETAEFRPICIGAPPLGTSISAPVPTAKVAPAAQFEAPVADEFAIKAGVSTTTTYQASALPAEAAGSHSPSRPNLTTSPNRAKSVPIQALNALASVAKKREEQEAAKNEQRIAALELAKQMTALKVEEIERADAEAAKLCNQSGGAKRRRVSCSGRELKDVPQPVSIAYASQAISLELSYNSLRSLKSIGKFVKLEELMADNNELENPLNLPSLPKLKVLSLNNNHITDLHEVIAEVKKSCPKIAFLSLLNNPACPSELNGCIEVEYDLYRQYVIKMLPGLNFLDSRRISHKEREDAENRFAYASVAPVTPVQELVSAFKQTTVRKVVAAKEFASKRIANLSKRGSLIDMNR